MRYYYDNIDFLPEEYPSLYGRVFFSLASYITVIKKVRLFPVNIENQRA